MKLPYLLVACSVVVLMSSCGRRVIEGSGPVKTVGRNLDGKSFNNIEVDGPIDAHINIGSTTSVSLEGYGNILPAIKTEIKNNTLHIYVDEITDIDVEKHIIANITVPSLAGLDISGSSDAVVGGALTGSEFHLDMSGNCSADIQELHVQRFDADMSGSTALVLRAGDINNGNYEISGSGDIKSFGVIQQTAALDMSGSADAQVNVATKLDVDISGSGSVAYKGHPSVHQDISGAGSVTEAN